MNYFDNTYYNKLGININDYAFDKEKGYSIINANGVSVLLYRIDKISEVFSKAMQEYLDLKDVSIYNDNQTKEKKARYRLRRLSKSYKKTLKTFKLQKEQLIEIYDSKVMKHFIHGRDSGIY